MAKAPRPAESRRDSALPLSGAGGPALPLLSPRQGRPGAAGGTGRAVVAFAPAGAAALFEALRPRFTLLRRAMAIYGAGRISPRPTLCDGCEAAILIDSDSPTLPVELLDRAVTLAAPGSTISWWGRARMGAITSSASGARTGALRRHALEHAGRTRGNSPAGRRAGLRTVGLPAWYDVDTGADLARLTAELVADPRGGAPHARIHPGASGRASRRGTGGRLGGDASRAAEAGRGRAEGAHWRRWGPYLSERQWAGPRRLQPRRYRVGVLPSRPRRVPRLPLGRGRDRRHLGQPPALCFGARPCGTGTIPSSRSALRA